MARKQFVINPGSASKKYALYEDGIELFKIHFELEDGKTIATKKVDGRVEKLAITPKQYDSALEYTLQAMEAAKVIDTLSEIAAAGVRIVAPGDYFTAHKILDREYEKRLKEAEPRAPLHLRPAIQEISQLRQVLPKVPLVAASDSAFHATLPPQARYYNLPREMAKKFEIYRFGYHGLSAQSVLGKIKNLLGAVPPKTIISHLGSGSSLHAIKNGVGFDTTMGFTPLEGLTMGTRIGNIDAGAVLFLLQQSGMGPAELEEYFHTKCGLLGLSGRTADIRELIKMEESGDENAKMALDAFAYSIHKYIGAYTAALEGLDLLIFTATIGERSPAMRSRITQNLKALRIEIDEEKNRRTISRDGFVEKEDSPVKIAVIVGDEMGQIAEEVRRLLQLAPN